MRVDFSRLLACLAVCFAAAAIGGFFTAPAIGGWYTSLAKPSFTPPSWVFGPIWTVLYALMAFSLYLFWNAKAKKFDKRWGYAFFGAQLALNAIWSIVFFGLHDLRAAFSVIVALEAFIAASILVFGKVSRKAALLLVPYALWVAFAGVLNYSIAALN